MKKFLKWFLIVLAILFAIHLVYSLITAKVYFNIYTAMKEKVESEETFYSKVLGTISEDDTMEEEIFIKDNVFIKKLKKINTKNNETVELKFWQKYLPNKTENEDGTGYIFTEAGEQKGGSKFAYDETSVEPDNKMYRYNLASHMGLSPSLQNSFFEYTKFEDYTYSKILLSVLKCPTILYSTEFNGQKVYAVKQFYIFEDIGVFLYDESSSMFSKLIDMFSNLFLSHTDYISKETKLPVGTNVGINGLPTTYEYFTKQVTDEHIKLPNLEEYSLQEMK